MCIYKIYINLKVLPPIYIEERQLIRWSKCEYIHILTYTYTVLYVCNWCNDVIVTYRCTEQRWKKRGCNFGIFDHMEWTITVLSQNKTNILLFYQFELFAYCTLFLNYVGKKYMVTTFFTPNFCSKTLYMSFLKKNTITLFLSLIFSMQSSNYACSQFIVHTVLV